MRQLVWFGFERPSCVSLRESELLSPESRVDGAFCGRKLCGKQNPALVV